MSGAPTPGETVSDDGARGIGRLLLVTLVLVAVLVALAIPLLVGDYRVYGSIVLGIAVVLGVTASLARRAVRQRTPAARRLSIVTGALVLVLSVPLMPIWVGLLTAVTGIGLLVVTLAPEREPS